MSAYLELDDPFLSSLSVEAKQQIEERREMWGLRPGDFYTRLGDWFANFDSRDKPLALKLLLKLEYYSESRFGRQIMRLKNPVARFLAETGRQDGDIVVITPRRLADSADRHAYDIIKKWGLSGQQVQKAGNLRLSSPSVVVMFNDTHGTGNQFLRELWPDVRQANVTGIFVLAVTISTSALKRFRAEIPGVRILPDTAAVDVSRQLTAAEFSRVLELGRRVYPRHPLGYGGAGLLVAYYYQCPNNTLPLIWADGKNNQVKGSAFPWTPLFPYIPKKKARTVGLEKTRQTHRKPSSKVVEAPNWKWAPNELDEIMARVGSWGLLDSRFCDYLRRWLGNFGTSEKGLALELLQSISYIGRAGVEQAIQNLYQNIMADVRGAGGGTSDIVLVTTGDSRESVYHYVYDFMRLWGLEIDQVCSVEELHPNAVIDRTLVFFYHTRRSLEFFRREHWPRVSQFRPRRIFIAAYAMADEACGAATALSEIVRTARFEESSRSVLGLISGQWHQRVCEISDLLVRDSEASALDRFLVSYYFQTPAESSPLLWADTEGDSGRNLAWSPLFPRVRKIKQW